MGIFLTIFVVFMALLLIYEYGTQSKTAKRVDRFLTSRNISPEKLVTLESGMLGFNPETQEVVFVNWNIYYRQPNFIDSDGLIVYSSTPVHSYFDAVLPYGLINTFFVESGADENAESHTFIVSLKSAHVDPVEANSIALEAYAYVFNKRKSEELQRLIKFHLGDEFVVCLDGKRTRPKVYPPFLPPRKISKGI